MTSTQEEVILESKSKYRPEFSFDWDADSSESLDNFNLFQYSPLQELLKQIISRLQQQKKEFDFWKDTAEKEKEKEREEAKERANKQQERENEILEKIGGIQQIQTDVSEKHEKLEKEIAKIKQEQIEQNQQIEGIGAETQKNVENLQKGIEQSNQGIETLKGDIALLEEKLNEQNEKIILIMKNKMKGMGDGEANKDSINQFKESHSPEQIENEIDNLKMQQKEQSQNIEKMKQAIESLNINLQKISANIELNNSKEFNSEAQTPGSGHNSNLQINNEIGGGEKTIFNSNPNNNNIVNPNAITSNISSSDPTLDNHLSSVKEIIENMKKEFNQRIGEINQTINNINNKIKLFDSNNVGGFNVDGKNGSNVNISSTEDSKYDIHHIDPSNKSSEIKSGGFPSEKNSDINDLKKMIDSIKRDYNEQFARVNNRISKLLNQNISHQGRIGGSNSGGEFEGEKNYENITSQNSNENMGFEDLENIKSDLNFLKGEQNEQNEQIGQLNNIVNTLKTNLKSLTDGNHHFDANHSGLNTTSTSDLTDSHFTLNSTNPSDIDDSQISSLINQINQLFKVKVDKADLMKALNEKSEAIERLDQVKADSHVVARKAEREYVDNNFEKLRKDIEALIQQTTSGTSELFAKDLEYLKGLIDGMTPKSDFKKLRDTTAKLLRAEKGSGDGLAGRKAYKCLSCNRTMNGMRIHPMSMNFQSFVNHLPNAKTRLYPRNAFLNDPLTDIKPILPNPRLTTHVTSPPATGVSRSYEPEVRREQQESPK